MHIYIDPTLFKSKFGPIPVAREKKNKLKYTFDLACAHLCTKPVQTAVHSPEPLS